MSDDGLRRCDAVDSFEAPREVTLVHEPCCNRHLGDGQALLHQLHCMAEPALHEPGVRRQTVGASIGTGQMTPCHAEPPADLLDGRTLLVVRRHQECMSGLGERPSGAGTGQRRSRTLSAVTKPKRGDHGFELVECILDGAIFAIEGRAEGGEPAAEDRVPQDRVPKVRKGARVVGQPIRVDVKGTIHVGAVAIGPPVMRLARRQDDHVPDGSDARLAAIHELLGTLVDDGEHIGVVEMPRVVVSAEACREKAHAVDERGGESSPVMPIGSPQSAHVRTIHQRARPGTWFRGSREEYGMTAYIVAHVDVQDWDKYREYMKYTPRCIAGFGGRFVARGGETTTLEGPPDSSRIVLIEFPSIELAKAFYRSEEYAQTKKLRDGGGTARFVAIAGYDEGAWQADLAASRAMPPL